jgi:RNA polymerase sigma factor (sigma-70 family)
MILISLLRQLPEKRQVIFKMNRIDGFSYKEIAEILSISIHTVQNQMIAAVKFIIRSDLGIHNCIHRLTDSLLQESER